MSLVTTVELVIFTGLQASGKSTFFQERFAQTHAHVSKDLFPNNRNPNRRQAHLIEEALSAGCSVVVDNTNPTPQSRKEPIELGHKHDARIVGYFFDSTLQECLQRNRRRRGRERVPDVALYATAKKLLAPSYLEGFDELYRVRLAGGFEVHPCGPEDRASPSVRPGEV